MTQRALVFMLPGLGDALTASPIIKALHGSGYSVDALTMLEPVTEYLSDLPEIGEVIELPLLSNSFAGLMGLLKLRAAHYDLVVLPFPARRWQYAAAVFMVGGRHTLSHKYQGIAGFILRAIRATTIAECGDHKIFENIRLAEAIGAHVPPAYMVPQSWRSATLPGLLGIHSGSMNFQGNEAKRWPLQRFVELARAQAARGRRIRFFGGPNETADVAVLQQQFEQSDAIEFVTLPLEEAAKKISECDAFLANDSGVAHVAAALGVRTLVLFGMTDPLKCTPVGAVPFRPSSCPACYVEGSADFTCARNINFRCVREDITVEAVDAALEALFRGETTAPDPVQAV